MPRPQRSPCVQCRYRKVRCDRRKDTCGSCERLNFECSFRQPALAVSGKKTPGSTPPERCRASRACLACRRLKARCSGELPECDNCRRLGKQCRYSSGDRLVKPLEVVNSSDGLGQRPLFPMRRQEMMEILDRFFRHLYPIPSFSILHEPSIRQQCLSGTLGQPLALVLAAVTNVFLPSGELELADWTSWIRRAEAEIWENLHQPSISRVQTLILLVHFHIQNGEFARAYMLAGMAARSATALRLNYERTELGPIAQETRRRVLWALTSIDGHFSVGLAEYETMPYAVVYQQLPRPEEEFSGGTNENAHPNLLAACFRLSKIQRDVMRLTRQLAISDKPLLELPSLVQEIQNDLWRFHSDLELSADYSISATANALTMKGSRWFARYLLASLSWHQVHCDLYRIFLPGYAEAVPTTIMDSTNVAFQRNAVEMCLIHVQQIFKVLAGVLQLDVPVLPSYLAVCSYQAARLVLFLPSLSCAKAEINTHSARAHAETSLAILHKFFSLPPWATDIIADLQRLIQAADYDRTVTTRAAGVFSSQIYSTHYRHDQLAVHSLIRQAKFVDDGYEF
ncbi:uncharacterized protein BDV14DRAFT_211299 [Aspergillus stella-maris]|uniref:uncharacterized protein n=1 Tax=Aspergillus stella-maris TaxID=1810926 RepID=UPI003CCCFF92